MMKSALFISLSIAVCHPAFAANKCTAADGKIAYQDQPCSNASKATELSIQGNTSNSQAGWNFSREKDEMDGHITCFALSPPIYTGYRGANSRMITVHMQISMTKSTPLLLTIRTSTSGSDLFHNDLEGMGVKVDNKEFVPITKKFNVNAIGFFENSALDVMQQLETGKQIKMRLRFWPYVQLHDTDPISLNTFKTAWTKARECLKKEL